MSEGPSSEKRDTLGVPPARLEVSVLREAPVRRLLGAQWASLSGDWAMMAALPFVVFSLGGGPGDVGLCFAVSAFSLVGLVLFGGVLADRHGRRGVLLLAELGRMVTQGALAVSLLLGTAHLWQVVAALATIGAGAALAQPASTGLMAEIVPTDRLQDANALRGMLVSMAMLTGPALAGAALLVGGPGAAVALDAASFGLSALLLRGMRPPAGAWQAGAGGTLLGELRAGWWEFSRRTWLWVMVCGFALFNMLVFAPFEVLGAQIANDSLGGAAAWSAILTGFGLGQIVGAAVALAWRPGRPLLAVTLLVLGWVPLLFLLGGEAPLAAIVGAAALTGLGWLVLTAIWEATLQAQVPHAQLSRVSSYDWLGATALMPVGLIIAAPAGSALGAGAGLRLSAAITVALTVAVLAVPGVRRMPRARPTGGRCDLSQPAAPEDPVPTGAP